MEKKMQDAQEKKTYEAPKLVEWGSITEITQGTGAGTKDGFTGSVGT